jgi:hypothetical protein
LKVKEKINTNNYFIKSCFGANLVKDALSIHLDLGSKKQQKNVGTQEGIRGKIDYFIFRVVYSICKNSSNLK